VRKSLLVKKFCAEDSTGLKVDTEAVILCCLRTTWEVRERSIHDQLSSW